MPFEPDRYAFVEGTTDEEMQQFLRREANLAEGLCANGCAPMVLIDPQTRRCPVCGFVNWRNIPWKTGATEEEKSGE